jgi:hypothetical protein
MSLKHFGLMSLYLRIHNHHKNHFREFPKSTLLILIWLSAGALLEKQPLRGMMAHTELGYVVSNRTHVDKVVRRVRELCAQKGGHASSRYDDASQDSSWTCFRTQSDESVVDVRRKS